MGAKYTVSDGKLMLVLEAAEEGGYIVTSPLDPQLITEADSLEEAFVMAYDVRELLVQARAEMARRMTPSPSPSDEDNSNTLDPPPSNAVETDISATPVASLGSMALGGKPLRNPRPSLLRSPGDPPAKPS